MAFYTRIATAQVRNLLEFLPRGEDGSCPELTAEPESVADGAMHSVYRLRTTDGDYILKMMEPVDLAIVSATFEEQCGLQRHAHAQGAHVAELIHTGTLPNGRIFTLQRAVEGCRAYPPSEQDAQRVGEALAKFHTALKDYPAFTRDTPSLSALAWAEAKSCLHYMRGGVDKIGPTAHYVASVMKHLPGRIALEQKGLPVGVIHGDLTESNVLVGKDKAFLIDFETVQKRPLLEDIAAMVYHFAILPEEGGRFRFDPALADRLLKSYDSERAKGGYGALTDDEQRLLPWALRHYAQYRWAAEQKVTLEGKALTVTADGKRQAAGVGAEHLKNGIGTGTGGVSEGWAARRRSGEDPSESRSIA